MLVMEKIILISILISISVLMITEVFKAFVLYLKFVLFWVLTSALLLDQSKKVFISFVLQSLVKCFVE